MKLITFSHQTAPRPGVALNDRVGLDLAAADPSLTGGWPELFCELDCIRRLVERHLPEAAGFDATSTTGSIAPPLLHLAQVRLLPPVISPSKIIAVGLNYRDHATEQDKPLPAAPMLFSKAPSCLQAPHGPIEIPADLDRVDAEAELALVVGKRGRAISQECAAQHIAGYMCLNDVSDRAAQYADRQFFRGKSLDTGGPCGPWLVTPDELPDQALGLRITCHWNDVLMQASSTEQLIFTPHFLISYISHHMTLLPGDIITTGTPGGVGVFHKPPVFLAPGDVVEVAIAGIGAIRNPVVRWEPAP